MIWLAARRSVGDHPGCDQPAHVPQPRTRRSLRRARRGRGRRDRHHDQRAGDRSERDRVHGARRHDARRQRHLEWRNGPLDLRCEGAAAPVVAANVRPTAAGIWTITLPAAAVSALTPRTCYLHAVPHGNAGTNRTAFAGKRVMFQRYRVTAVVGGPNNGVPYDFRYWAPH